MGTDTWQGFLGPWAVKVLWCFGVAHPAPTAPRPSALTRVEHIDVTEATPGERLGQKAKPLFAL